MLNLKEAWIVDDDEVFIFVFENVLKECRHFNKIISFNQGKTAINSLQDREKAQSSFPDVIFCDLRMPFYNLMDFIKEADQLNFLDKVKIIGVTVSSHPDDIELLKSNNIPYLQKPVNAHQVTNILSGLFVR